MNMNAKYFAEYMGDTPVTWWRGMSDAASPETPTGRKALEELISLYDGPLLSLFNAFARGDEHWAEEAKQDFVGSHFLTGKVFDRARPIGRFRTFLAVVVRNFISDRRRAERTGKNGPNVGATPISAVEDPAGEPLDPEDPRTVREAQGEEVFLSRSRAIDIVNAATEDTEQWCKAQRDGLVLSAAFQRLLSDDEEPGVLRRKADPTPEGRVAEEYRRALRRRTLEELVVNAREDEEMIAGREAAILLDALARKESPICEI